MSIDGRARKLLKRLKTGQEVLDIVHGSPDCRYGKDPLQNNPEEEKVEELFGLIGDYKDICPDENPDDCVEAAFTLTMLIRELDWLGIWVVGAPGEPDAKDPGEAAATIQVKRKTNKDNIMIRL